MKSLKLLNVEYSQENAAMLSNYLTINEFDAQIKWVKTIDEMKNELKSQDWDIIISGHRMPKFSGFEILKAVREYDFDIPVIFISEVAGEETAVQMMVAGADDYLLKSDLIRLIPAVEREVQKAEERRTNYRSEKKSRENEKRLKLALSSNGIGIWSFDIQNNLIECSEDCLEILQLTDFSGKLEDFKSLIHSEDVEFVLSEIKNVIENNNLYVIEYRIINSRGEITWIIERGAVERNADGKAVRMTGIIANITQRKKLEQNLRISEERFRALCENSVAGVTLCDRNGRLFYVNDAYLKIIGYTREDFENGKLNWRKITAPDFEEADQLALAQARVNGVSEQYEKEYICKDGSRIPVLLGVALSDIDGGEHFVSAILDISKREIAEKQVRESEANYRVLTEVTSDIIWSMIDNRVDKTFLAWWENLTGQTEEEVSENGWLNVVNPEDRELVKNDWNKAMENKAMFNTVCRVKMVSGEYCFLAVRCVPVFDDSGNFRQWIGAMTDVTDRKRGEEAIQRSERRFRSLVNSISQIVWTADPEGVLQTANTPEGEPVRITKEDIIREWLSRLHPEDKNTAIGDFKEAVWEKRKFKSEYRLLNIFDNTYHYYIARGTPVFDDDGTVCEWVGTLSDVTKSKLAEDELNKSEEQLRQAQKLESVGRLAGGIAHDFNNMLTAINGYSELTLRRLSFDDPLRHNIEAIKKAGERSAELTHQLLAFSRQQILQPKVLDINAVISETTKMLNRLIGENIELVTKSSCDNSNIKADPGQISQMLTNLIVNSRDALPSGGKITIETENVYLNKEYVSRLQGVAAGDYLLLRITDTGTGIDEENMSRIFEPFFTTKEPGKGTGLGLASVYGIVKQSNGHIQLESRVGVGTTFEIYLPQNNEISGLTDELAILENLPRGREIILLAEDEKTVRVLTCQLLEFFGYQVIPVENGIEALRICREMGGRIDLLITDVVMPQMSGWELAEEINKNYPRIKTLFISGYTDDSIIKHGLVDLKKNFIQKPFTLETLALKVRSVINEKGEY